MNDITLAEIERSICRTIPLNKNIHHKGMWKRTTCIHTSYSNWRICVYFAKLVSWKCMYIVLPGFFTCPSIAKKSSWLQVQCHSIMYICTVLPTLLPRFKTCIWYQPRDSIRWVTQYCPGCHGPIVIIIFLGGKIANRPPSFLKME
jgi:hypothetical protein